MLEASKPHLSPTVDLKVADPTLTNHPCTMLDIDGVCHVTADTRPSCFFLLVRETTTRLGQAVPATELRYIVDVVC